MTRAYVSFSFVVLLDGVAVAFSRLSLSLRFVYGLSQGG